MLLQLRLKSPFPAPFFSSRGISVKINHRIVMEAQNGTRILGYGFLKGIKVFKRTKRQLLNFAAVEIPQAHPNY